MSQTVNEDYLFKEVDKLNKEVESIMAEIRTRERYSLTIIAAVGGYLLLHKDSFDNRVLFKLASVIPLCTTLLLGFSVKYLYRNIGWIGEYLKEAEKHFYKDKGTSAYGFEFGWERFFDKPGRKKLIVSITELSWYFQILLSIALIWFSWNVKV